MNGAPQDLRPLIAIGVPAGDRVHTEFAQCLWGLGRGAKNHRQGIVFGASSMITNARNQCVDGAHQVNADYICFVDSDMTYPYQTNDILLSHKKDIVCATYVRRGPPFDILGHSKHEKDRDARAGLVEMDYIPTGILLIKMTVFEKLYKPFFRFIFTQAEVKGFKGEGFTKGEDFYFSQAAREAGFSLWCDLDLSKEIAHMYQYGLRITDPAVKQTRDQYNQMQKDLKVANG